MYYPPIDQRHQDPALQAPPVERGVLGFRGELVGVDGNLKLLRRAAGDRDLRDAGN